MNKSTINIAVDFLKNRYLPWLHTRPSTSFLMEHFKEKKDIVSVEIGSQYGYNAYNILSNLSIKKLYLVDPYESYQGYDEDWASDKGVNNAYQKCKQVIKPYEKSVVFVLRYSQDAIDDIPNGVDFVYIDGNHQYEYVKKDMDSFYPKICSGGVLCGHDFGTHELGVCRAVIEFSKKHNLSLFGEQYDWWMVKK